MGSPSASCAYHKPGRLCTWLGCTSQGTKHVNVLCTQATSSLHCRLAFVLESRLLLYLVLPSIYCKVLNGGQSGRSCQHTCSSNCRIAKCPQCPSKGCTLRLALLEHERQTSNIQSSCQQSNQQWSHPWSRLSDATRRLTNLQSTLLCLRTKLLFKVSQVRSADTHVAIASVKKKKNRAWRSTASSVPSFC